MNEFLLSSHTSLSMRVYSHMLPTSLRPESDRNFLDLSEVKRRRRNRKNGHQKSIASNTVSVETCISFLKKIEKVVLQLFTFTFLKTNIYDACVCMG